MKLGKKEINLLIGLLGILIAAGVWMFVASPMKEKTEVLKSENIGLKEKAEEYQAINAQRASFEAETVELTDERARLLSAFPAGMRREDEIMYWANMERANANDLAMNNLSMGAWEEVFVAGQPAATGEGATQLHLYKAPVTYTYKATYEGIKNVVKYVFAQNDKKSISRITAAYDAGTGNLVGAVDINMYYMKGTGNEYVPYTMPTVPTGVADVFHSTETLANASDVSGFDTEDASEAEESEEKED